MKTKTKALALVLCAVLLVVTTVFVTVAFLTSQTEVVTNTFTAGEVKITLDEAKVDEYGVEVAGADRVTANTYKLIPGRTYTKDPQVHVAAGSEDCWLFVKVENGLGDNETTIATQMATNGWTLVSGQTNIYAYNATVSAGADVTVFESITISGTAEVASLAGKTINVTAYAVQADGFDTAAEAWAVAPSTFSNN